MTGGVGLSAGAGRGRAGRRRLLARAPSVAGRSCAGRRWLRLLGRPTSVAEGEKGEGELLGQAGRSARATLAFPLFFLFYFLFLFLFLISFIPKLGKSVSVCTSVHLVYFWGVTQVMLGSTRVNHGALPRQHICL
jgi:hypothetical protein